MFFKYGDFKKGRKVHLNVEVMMSYIKNIFESDPDCCEQNGDRRIKRIKSKVPNNEG